MRLVDVIFGVIMAQGFVMYRNNIVAPALSLENGSLVLVYATVILSWMGYHKSVIGYPYNKTLWSRIRLASDILILVLYSYLVFIAQNLGMVLIGLVVVFTLYAATGFIRIIEWRDRKVSQPQLAILFCLLFLFEFYALDGCEFCVSSVSKNLLSPILLIGAFVLLLGYRVVRGRIGYPTILPVGIDVDGVLGDQVPPVLMRLQSRGIGLGLTKDKITQWDLVIDNTSIDGEIEAALLDPEYVREMPVIQGSTTAMTELYKRFHIVIATSRPMQTEEDTVKWLKRNFSRSFHEYANTRVVGKETLGLRILVDDYGNNVKRFAAEGGTALLFSQPWNVEKDSEISELLRSGRVIRCNGWGEVKEALYRMQEKIG